MPTTLDRDYFSLFGLPPVFAIDVERLDALYRELQRQVHPDRFGAAGEGERRLALERAAHINEAYRTLKDPLRRARYLLERHGLDPTTRQDVAADFLAEQMALREALEDIRQAPEAAEGLARLSAFLEEIEARWAAGIEGLAERLASGREDWEAACRSYHELSYLQRLREEALGLEEELEERARAGK